jgi:hypothetical protein
VSSSAAYWVPTAEVARRFLDETLARKSISHYDMELNMSAHMSHLLFPSPFESETTTGCSSDVMNSQSAFFTTRYTAMKHPCRL